MRKMKQLSEMPFSCFKCFGFNLSATRTDPMKKCNGDWDFEQLKLKCCNTFI
jgi:hypothetical protein